MRVVTFFLSGVCHQLPEHSLVYEGRALPLCARCSGMHAGIILALVALWALREGRPRRLPGRRASTALAVLAALWLVDGVNSLVHWVTGAGLFYQPSNALRLLTGMGMGLALGTLLYPIYHFALFAHTEDRRVLDRDWPLMPLLIAGTGLSLVALLWRSAPYSLWAAVFVASALVGLSIVNAVIIVLALGREGRGESGAALLPYIAPGVLAALLETGIVASARHLIGA